MTRAGYIATAATLAVGILPAAANAAPTRTTASRPASTWIGKREARGYALKAVRQLYREVDWATTYWVEHSPSCERVSGSVVECDYALEDTENGFACGDAVQVISLSSTKYRIRWPYKADCSS